MARRSHGVGNQRLVPPLLIILLLLSCWRGAAKYFEPHVDITSANELWKSKGCAETGLDELNVFGAVRVAIKTEYREVSLAMDGAWMDRFLQTGYRVLVTCIPHDELGAAVMPGSSPSAADLEGMGWAPKSAEEEVLQAVYSYTPPQHLSATALESSAAEQPVDRFVLHNPCWLVLHDATVKSSAANNTSDALRHHPHHHHHRQASLAPGLYTHANVLVKLPAFPLQMTCKLFLAVAQRQFPGEAVRCPRREERFFYSMQSFGFGGEANKVIKTFAFNLANSETRVYTAPLADKYLWSWADPRICGEARYRRDPWSCSFLPLSNCTHHGAAAAAEPEEADLMAVISKGWGDYSPNKETQHAFLKLLKIDGNMLVKFGDGAALQQEPATWVSVRLYALLLRPNLRTRYLMRRALDTRIVRLHRSAKGSGLGPEGAASSAVSLRGGGGGGAALATRHRVDEVSDDAGAADVPLGLGAGLGLARGWGRSCLGMHVRNADVLTDWRKGRRVDRSLNAHVYLAHNLTRGLALRDVFLATDNASLFHIAPTEYPEYRWFAQQRPITAYEQQAARGSLHHLHESEPQREIANLLVDALLVARCEAMVGQGDGSVTLLFHMLGCNLANARGACPPFFDLQRIADDGIMPYVGAHVSASTWATFHRWADSRSR